MTTPWYFAELACPDCERPLPVDGDSLRCICGFSASAGAQPDLRPQHPESRLVPSPIGSSAATDLEGLNLERPEVTYTGPAAARNSSELFSAAREWLPAGSRMLDLGCGPRDQAVPAGHLKLEYVGVDFSSPEADILGDGHAIPFRRNTFDGVLAYAVLEHLYAPGVALRDVVRVLRPGGVFFGAVSQGEPFHDSYFHHTAWGVLAAFRAAGLTVVRLWASYDTLHGLAMMGRYPKLIRPLIELVYRLDRGLPFLAPRRFSRASPREKRLEEVHRAASLCFVATKAEEPAR